MSGVALSLELGGGGGLATGFAVVNNGAGEAVRLWEPGNAWGDDAWSFELVRDGAAQPIARLPQTYTRNVPASREVAAEATERWAFDLADGTWDVPAAVGGARLVVIYDAPDTPERAEHGVLAGPLRSAPVAF